MNEIPNRIKIANLVREDPAAVLDTLAGLHLLDLSVIPSHIDVIRRHRSGFGNEHWHASADITEEPEVVSLNIKPSRNTEPGFLDDLGGVLQNYSVRDVDFRAGAKKLRLRRPKTGATKSRTL